MLNDDWDPYQEIIELKQFAVQADKHLVSLTANQKQFINAINESSAKIEKLEKRVKTLEGVINAYFADAEARSKK